VARTPAIAVIDIGKSNAKLAIVDSASLEILDIATTSNRVAKDGPYPHHDVDRLWTWIRAGLRTFASKAEIGTISVTTHGACFALLAGDDLALPVLDYEYDGPETVRAAYAAARGDFRETLSPDLPNGLNAGRQLYWLRRAFPDVFAKVDAFLPYPQYWGWRFTGVKASEATSLGCHTDLWNPGARTFSTLAMREGWQRLFPPLRRPWDTLGTITPALVEETGLPPTCRVVTGIHDSNASLLPHLIGRPRPFSVLSSGTWMIVLAPGGSLAGLDATRDCLANVDAFGDPVPSARFMAGREFELMTGGAAGVTTDAALTEVVTQGIMALPTFAPGTGPFAGLRDSKGGRWLRGGAPIDPAALSADVRAAAASLYLALVTETCLTLAGAAGPIVVEGPLARNALFLSALAARVGRPVLAEPDATGTTQGAALLALMPGAKPLLPIGAPVEALKRDLSDYARQWLAAAETESK
jgi:sugar (pentulose or hexulose) kinase